jgi:hypothetical protein
MNASERGDTEGRSGVHNQGGVKSGPAGSEGRARASARTPSPAGAPGGIASTRAPRPIPEGGLTYIQLYGPVAGEGGYFRSCYECVDGFHDYCVGACCPCDCDLWRELEELGGEA